MKKRASSASKDAPLLWLGSARPPVLLPKKETSAEARAFRRGAAAAAAQADEYNGSSTHGYRLGDCILGKMNLRAGSPRQNRRRVEAEAKDWDAGWLMGFAQALIEVHQHRQGVADLAAAARRYGLTLTKAKRAGLSRPEIKKLGHAGVPR